MFISKYYCNRTPLRSEQVNLGSTIFNFLFLTCVLCVCSNLNGMLHDSLESPIFTNLEKNCNHMLTDKFGATTESKSNGSSEINQYTCTEIDHKHERYDNKHNNLFGGLDTITKEDIVRNQYLSFPYPAVTKEDIQIEKDYYNSTKRNTPFGIAREITLESINHYLYKGRNTYRCVSI